MKTLEPQDEVWVLSKKSLKHPAKVHSILCGTITHVKWADFMLASEATEDICSKCSAFHPREILLKDIMKLPTLIENVELFEQFKEPSPKKTRHAEVVVHGPKPWILETDVAQESKAEDVTDD